MSSQAPDIVLPRALQSNGQNFIPAPPESSFTAQFGNLLPPAQFLTSGYGTTAYYDLPAKSTTSTSIQRVIFVHGVGTPALGLLPLASKLQSLNPNLHIVLYDLWGHGLSTTPLSPHVPALFHSQILHILAHLKWSTAHIFGFSFGGTTVGSFATYYPGLVESVTLVAPAGFLRISDLTPEQQSYMRGGPGVEEAARDWILTFLEGGPMNVPDDWRECVKRGEIVPSAVRAWERKEHRGHIASVAALFRDGDVFDNHKRFRALADSGIKTYALLGAQEGICSEQDLKAVGLNNVAVIPNAGHGVVRESVPEVAAAIHEFWNSLN